MKNFALGLLLLLMPFLISMSKKQSYTISFHLQGSDTDMNKTMFPMVLDGRSIKFKLLPEFSHHNVVAFHPFPSESGDNGVALQLDFRASNSLEMLTPTQRGAYLLAMVNGQPADYVRIDRLIDDGIITIWQGIDDLTVAELEKKHPRIKSQSTPSVNPGMEMMPTTPGEKKRFMKRKKQMEENPESEPAIRSFNKPSAVEPTLPSVNDPMYPLPQS